MRSRLASVLFLTMLGLIGVQPATAQPVAPSLPPNATVVASGLINPRGFTFAPDGALIVAEAGAVPDGFVAPFDPPTPMFRPVSTTTGRVSRVDLATGERTTLADALPSSAGSFGDTLGPANVAYLGTDLYVLISAGPVHGWPNYPSGVYKVNPDGTVRPVANLDAFNSKNPVAFIPPDDEISNPYDMVAADGMLWITDGNRNQVYKVGPDGAISRAADLSVGHPILTGITTTPAGSVVLVELTAVPYVEGSGRILRMSATGEVVPIVRAATAATGVAAVDDDTIFVVEHSVSLGKPPFLAPDTGRLARLTADGKLETIAGGLTFPTIARIGPDGAVYVANVSVGGDHGEGQILPDRHLVWHVGTLQKVGAVDHLATASGCSLNISGGEPTVRRKSPVMLALVVLLVGMLAAGSASARPAQAASAVIDIKDLAYSPATIQVAPGDTVTWMNSEEIMPHDVTSGTLGQPDAGQLFGSEILMSGQSFTATFPEPGEFVYLCKLHPTMIGVVIVQPT